MTEKTQPSGTIPDHYRKCCGVIEPRELLKRMPFQLGNACKYLLRAPYKGSEKEDLLKALDYLMWAKAEEEHVWGAYDEFLIMMGFFENPYLAHLFPVRGGSFGRPEPAYDFVAELIADRLAYLGAPIVIGGTDSAGGTE